MATKEVAIKKRAQIDKATQNMFIAVCAASIVLGAAIVLSIYFIKWMVFNARVIGEKSQIITDYKTIQGNVEKLAENVQMLSENENLEVVARARENQCMNFTSSAVDTPDRIELARICSALRVIPEALPSTENLGATLASLNKLFLETNDEQGNPVDPDSVNPGSTESEMELSEGLGIIPVSLAIEKNSVTTRAVLDTIERSIRNFDIQTATIAWRSSSAEGGVDMIELRGNAVAYYSSSVVAAAKQKTIYADDSKARDAAATAGAEE